MDSLCVFLPVIWKEQLLLVSPRFRLFVFSFDSKVLFFVFSYVRWVLSDPFFPPPKTACSWGP